MSNPLEAAINGINGLAGVGLADPLARFVGYAANQVWPNTLPGAGDIYDLWRAGLLADRDAGVALSCLGVRTPRELNAHETQPRREVEENVWPSGAGEAKVWDAYWSNRVQIPGTGDVLRALNLQIITNDYATKLLKQQGWWDDKSRNLVVDLSRTITPLPADLVSFALREAWDVATVNRFSYDAEYPAEFAYWMDRLGANADARVSVDGVPQGPKVTWSQLYWRVHWANISPTQAYEMFQRLRPGRWERYARDLPGLRGFPFADLAQVLKINDYPVPFRPQLAAIAYRRPRLVDIDRFYRNGSIDEDEVYQLHLDLGYSPPDARLRTDWLISEQRKRETPVPKTNPVPAILQLYRLGILSRGETQDRLETAISGGAIVPGGLPPANPAAQAAADRVRRQVQVLIADSDNKQAAREAADVVQTLRRQFLRGQTSELEARTALYSARFQGTAVDAYIRQWQRVLQSGRLLMSTARIKALVVKGILPFAEAERMLSNLGWKAPEIKYLLAELQRDYDIEAERVLERQARTTERRDAARLRQAQMHDRERRRIIRQLNQQATPAALHKYYTRGIITRREYETELTRRGYDDQAVKRITSAAEIDRQEYLARRAKQRLTPPVPGQFPTAETPAPTGSEVVPPAPQGSAPAPP